MGGNLSFLEGLGALVRTRRENSVLKEIEPLHVPKDNLGLPRGPRGLFNPTGTPRKPAYTFNTFKERPQQTRKVGQSFASSTFSPVIKTQTVRPLSTRTSAVSSKPISLNGMKTSPEGSCNTASKKDSGNTSTYASTSSPLNSESHTEIKTCVLPVSKDVTPSTNDTKSVLSLQTYETTVISTNRPRKLRPRKQPSENLIRLRSEIENAYQQMESLQDCIKKLEENRLRMRTLKESINEDQIRLEKVFAAGVDELGRLRHNNNCYRQRLAV